MNTTTTPPRHTVARKPRSAKSAPAAGPQVWVVGVVQSATADGFSVSAAGQVLAARRATSCWLEVQVGDTVACMRDGARAWITAVLERQAPADAPQVLDCPAPLVLRSPSSLSLQAGDIQLQSQGLRVRAEQATLGFAQAEVVGERLSVVATTVKAIGALWSTLFDRVQHHSRQHLRTTDGVDRVQATHIEQEARQLLQLHSEHTLINGEKLVKARGAQIHFG